MCVCVCVCVCVCAYINIFNIESQNQRNNSYFTLLYKAVHKNPNI